jgi:alpha-beta hydrolase superfamily lysophospholipase
MKLRPTGNDPGRSITRRILLLGISLMVVAGLCAPAAHARPAASTGTEQPLRPTLPAPTGHHRIGIVQLHLVDETRPDPWVPTQPVRELMVSLWYPAQPTHRYPVAPWLPPAAWSRFEEDSGIPPGVLQVPLTHAAVGAPVDRDRGGRPVVLYSPGLGNNRDSGTVLVEELVSRGYIVATIDHTHDANAVEFPDGRVETFAIPQVTDETIEQAVAVRVADTRFVLDALTELNAGTNPDAEHRNLPPGLRGALRMSNVAMFGHSLGGATAAAAMLEDQRITSGVNLDGRLVGPVVNAGLDRPFLLVGNASQGRDTDETWAKFWANQRGWRLNLQLTDSEHGSFTDFQALIPQTADVLNLPPETVQQAVGTIDPHRSIKNQRAYLTAFFDTHLRHRDGHLLDHPSPRFPEMQFIP